MSKLKKILRLGQLKLSAKSAIAKHRRTYPVQLVHKLTRFIDEAYENEGSDFDTNGEKDLIGKLRKANFKTVLDAGANVGKWSRSALTTWPDCHVHAFEAAPNTFKELQREFQSTPLASRITLNDVALSDADGLQTMYYFAEAPELTCDMPRHESLVSVPFEVKTIRLDDYCKANGINAIDFLKVDVEGAEYRVLKGLSELLAAGKVNCLQFEYGAFSIQTRKLVADYYEMLAGNFWIGKIFPDYVAFQDYDWRMEGFKFCNYFCVSKSRPDLRDLANSKG